MTTATDDDKANSQLQSSLSETKPVDYRRLLTAFLMKKDPKQVSQVNKMLKKHKGKEPKLMLVLAKKYDSSNPLNRVFVDRVTEEHFGDSPESYLALTRLYLSIFYPQDVDTAEELCKKYKEKDQLFKKLSANFHAINPLNMNRSKTGEKLCAEPIDYKEVLTTFYEEHDPDKVSEVDDMLKRCMGKEAIMLSVLAQEYSTSNALNDVFENRLKATECKDHLTLLSLYLQVFHPSFAQGAKSLLSSYQGKETDLFSKLAKKFRACNALEVCVSLGKTLLESIDETNEENTNDPVVIEDNGCNACSSPKRSVHSAPIPQSPAVTP